MYKFDLHYHFKLCESIYHNRMINRD